MLKFVLMWGSRITQTFTKLQNCFLPSSTIDFISLADMFLFLRYLHGELFAQYNIFGYFCLTFFHFLLQNAAKSLDMMQSFKASTALARGSSVSCSKGVGFFTKSYKQCCLIQYSQALVLSAYFPLAIYILSSNPKH